MHDPQTLQKSAFDLKTAGLSYRRAAKEKGIGSGKIVYIFPRWNGKDVPNPIVALVYNKRKRALLFQSDIENELERM